MATTEELLAQLEAEAQSETPVCIIDPETRTVTVPPEYQLLGVENDKKVERLYFQCPKIVGDNQDLSQDYQLFINYENANGDPDAYRIDDMTVEGENITFSWLLEENVTKYKGNIKFAFGAIKPGDEADDPDKNRWNTTINTDCTCLVGLKCTQQVAESNPDALAQIWAAIDELKAGGGGSGGTTNYENLSNKPRLNGVTLEGNKTLDQVGVLAKNQGSSNSGKYLSVGSDGNVVPADAPSGGTVDPEQIKQAVNGYLEENPVSGMTAEQEEQLNQNTTDVADLKSALEQKITINRIDGVEGNFPTESTTENNLANEGNMNNYIAGFHGTHTYEGTSYSYTIEVSTDKNYILEFNGSLPDLSGNYKWLYEENSGSEIGTKNYRELSSYSDDSKTYLKYTPSENTNKITVNVMIQSLNFDIREGFGVYERSDFLPEEGTDGNYYIEKMFGLPFKCMNFSNDSGSSMSSMSANTYHEELKTYKGEFNTNDIETYRKGTDGDYWEYKGEEFITIDCHLITTNTYVYLKNGTFDCLPIVRTEKYKSNNYYDICIIGGGAGGVAAAYALKDSGYKVCLIEKNNELGGTHLCAGINTLLSSPVNGEWIKDICADGYAKGKVKITGSRLYGEGDEFEKKYNGALKTFGRGASDWGNGIIIDEAWGRKKYHDDLSESITIYFNSEFLSSIENNGTIYAVKVKNVVTEEEVIIYADYFIDASGDAVLCRYGREKGVDYFIGSDEKSTYNESAYNEIYEKSEYEINNYELCYYVTANYKSQYGNQQRTIDTSGRRKFTDISDDTACNAIIDNENGFFSQISPGRYISAPKELFVDLGSDAVLHNLRQRGLDHWEKYKVKALKSQYLDTYYPMLAIRESYRVKCDKMLTQDDVEHLVINSEIESNHIIALASWWCDSHSINSGINMGSVNNAFLNGIPYETIIPSTFKNVLIASRSFGCSHIASLAYRLTKTIMSLGYVAGLAMKMCRKNWLDDVRNVNITDLQNNCGIKELFELVDSIS